MSCCEPAPTVFTIQAPGDLLPTWIADAAIDGQAVNWTGWTLELVLRGPVIVSRTAQGDENGTITYEWVAGDTDVPGDYEVLVVGSSPDGKPQTFPVRGILRILAP